MNSLVFTGGPLDGLVLDPFDSAGTSELLGRRELSLSPTGGALGQNAICVIAPEPHFPGAVIQFATPGDPGGRYWLTTVEWPVSSSGPQRFCYRHDTNCQGQPA